MRAIAEIVHLDQGYRGSTVINDLSIDITEGVLGLLGPNGAGKTTLLNTLSTVMPPRSGTVTIAGVRVDSEARAREVRRSIGFLPQDFGGYPGFTVSEFVRYCAWLREVPSTVAARDVERVIEAVGLAPQRRTRLKALSGGMRRRAGIAAALVGSPKLVLLDEPTVGLDPAQRLDFRDLIRSMSDTAVVLSTHLVEDVAALCRDIAVMNAGALTFRGSPEELAGLSSYAGAGDSPLERGYMASLKAHGDIVV
ncbi:ATP-binding cassette domain-containing protein [Catenulispora sp. NF23]|uniref:ATP-binding cassette domain-containing protein n=1 Tax=Catenulispora pinistramenti TaxID=2705254 RepID=UPI001BA63DD7|nr:ATP-binding cassette domain-containing protein [Catenulispora pinistramenti]MBS2531662.1 ATP-binding cassette domain-containing protein [Catenulispora pinistramenti]